MFDDFEIDKKWASVGLIIVAFVLYFGVTSITNLPTGDPSTVADINDFGTLTLVSDVDEVPNLGTVNAQFGLIVTWEATVSTSDIKTYLYTVTGVDLEEGVHTSDAATHTFSFTLNGAPLGRTEMYIAFGGQYTADRPWAGSSNHFFVENSRTPEYAAPEFTLEPEDVTTPPSIILSFQWYVVYAGPATARFTVDGVTMSSRALIQTTSPQPLSFSTSFSEDGVHKVKLIIEPEFDMAYASEVIVTVQSNATTPTGTTHPTAPTTTTTNVTSTIMDGYDITTVAGAGVLIVIIVVIGYLQFRSDRD